ncbi:hypothetical protein PIB30_107329, partial [Stylosanthes scabra]|nr:hypothetical protein [Stylosanthes scabra]
MPLSLMKKLGIKEMKPTKVSLQMADKSVQYAQGIVENVLVKINSIAQATTKPPDITTPRQECK